LGDEEMARIKTKSSFVVLAGDIGGTNSRFGLFRAELLDE
jgi:glucokinase